MKISLSSLFINVLRKVYGVIYEIYKLFEIKFLLPSFYHSINYIFSNEYRKFHFDHFFKKLLGNLVLYDCYTSNSLCDLDLQSLNY